MRGDCAWGSPRVNPALCSIDWRQLLQEVLSPARLTTGLSMPTRWSVASGESDNQLRPDVELTERDPTIEAACGCPQHRSYVEQRLQDESPICNELPTMPYGEPSPSVK